MKMRNHLVNVWLFVAVMYGTYASASQNPDVPVANNNSNHLPYIKLFHQEQPFFTFISNPFLLDIMMLNSKIKVHNSLIYVVNFNRFELNHFFVQILIHDMLMKESLFEFLHDLKLYICAHVEVSCLACAYVSSAEKHAAVVELFAIIYTWCYKKTLLNFYFYNENPHNEHNYQTIQAEIKTIFNLLFVIYPRLMAYQFRLEKEMTYVRRSKWYLAILHSEIVKKYIWENEFYPINPHGINFNERKILMKHAKFSKLWKTYTDLYNSVFLKENRNDPIGFLNFVALFYTNFINLFKEFRQLQADIMKMPQNYYLSVILKYINCYIRWFYAFFSVVSRIRSKYAFYLERSQALSAMKFSQLFFNAISESRSEVSVNTMNIVWYPRLLLTDTYLLETAKIIETYSELAKMIANFIITELSIPTSLYYNSFFLEYNCWFPGLLKTIWDLHWYYYTPTTNGQTVDYLILKYINCECDIGDLQGLYYAVRKQNLTVEKLSYYTFQLLKQVSKSYSPNITKPNLESRKKAIINLYAIHILGFGNFPPWRNCSDSSITFKKCLIFAADISNFFVELRNSDHPKNLRMFNNIQPNPQIN